MPVRTVSESENAFALCCLTLFCSLAGQDGTRLPRAMPGG